jgi:hypothetical protein
VSGVIPTNDQMKAVIEQWLTVCIETIAVIQI